MVCNHGLTTMARLQRAALARCALALAFVGYTLAPRDDPEGGVGGGYALFVSDAFAEALAAVLFGSSGFLVILSYALAASCLPGPAERAYSGAVLNQCFQGAMFAAVAASLLVAVLLPKGTC